MAKNLPEIFEEMRQALLGRRPDHKWGASAGEAASAAVGGLKGLGGDTLTKTAEHFNEISPYIEQAGFEVIEIEVGLGLSPKVVAHLVLNELLEPEEQQALLDEIQTQNKTLTYTVVNSLFKTTEARRKLNFKRFHFTHIELELSILPTVVLKFRRNDYDGDDVSDVLSANEGEADSLLPET
ncbi:hypothetical protein GCM10017044_11760 [Kordiimonas sediminis]|uniref:Uncharacterized protein n=1 Tax=Kordiimonas sediminis TaxID=1735581 RepID=A0A919AQR7_9PROT|nr:hypothetical protein [Kordiimonas sediminis]GHF18866.1 hypothetical protein GCM10017044_11760 [Kordiimonas sediminis]